MPTSRDRALHQYAPDEGYVFCPTIRQGLVPESKIQNADSKQHQSPNLPTRYEDNFRPIDNTLLSIDAKLHALK